MQLGQWYSDKIRGKIGEVHGKQNVQGVLYSLPCGKRGGFPCILPYSGAGWDAVPEILLLGFLCVSLVPLRVQVTG